MRWYPLKFLVVLSFDHLLTGLESGQPASHFRRAFPLDVPRKELSCSDLYSTGEYGKQFCC
jgi:hypothetical protein